MGFSFCRTKYTALSYERLKYEIGVAQRPVTFAWAFTNEDGSRSDVGHMMVAGGYKTVAGDDYVVAYDPLCSAASQPAGSSLPCGYKEMLYTKYVSDAQEYLHWDDFYEIKKP